MDPSNYSSYARKLAEAFSEHPSTAEALRREVYYALVERAEGLKKLRKRITDALRNPDAHTEVDDTLDLYNGPGGLLVLFMGEEEAAERAAKTGKDERQLDIEGAIADAERDGAANRFPVDGGNDDDPPSLGLVELVVSLVRERGPEHVRASDEAAVAKALHGFARRDCLAIQGYYVALDMVKGTPAEAELRAPEELDELFSRLAPELPDAGGPDADAWLNEPLRVVDDGTAEVTSLTGEAEKG